jgi:hypothetical protein
MGCIALLVRCSRRRTRPLAQPLAAWTSGGTHHMLRPPVLSFAVSLLADDLAHVIQQQARGRRQRPPDTPDDRDMRR